jgi:hypothetical protein
MPEERMVKKVYKRKPMLTRSLGRPKNRWEDDIWNDMKKLKIKNWTSCIQDRNKWKIYFEKPKSSKNEIVAPKQEEEKKKKKIRRRKIGTNILKEATVAYFR